jgi:hypothetical protein
VTVRAVVYNVHLLVFNLRTLNDEPSEERPEINPTLIKFTKLIWLVRRSWRANGPRRSATSALKTTAVNVKSAIAELTLRLEDGVDLASRRKDVARLTKQKTSYV